jgi:hypothetical protein
MARKMTLESAIKQAQEADKRVKEAENNMSAAKKKQTECWARVDEIKAEQEQERFNSLAKIAIERFGENVTAEQFREMLDTILINDEVREYVDSEKVKHNVKTEEITSLSNNNVEDSTNPNTEE